jgi:hypothetical protein
VSANNCTSRSYEDGRRRPPPRSGRRRRRGRVEVHADLPVGAAAERANRKPSSHPRSVRRSARRRVPGRSWTGGRRASRRRSARAVSTKRCPRERAAERPSGPSRISRSREPGVAGCRTLANAPISGGAGQCRRLGFTGPMSCPGSKAHQNTGHGWSTGLGSKAPVGMSLYYRWRDCRIHGRNGLAARSQPRRRSPSTPRRHLPPLGQRPRARRRQVSRSGSSDGSRRPRRRSRAATIEPHSSAPGKGATRLSISHRTQPGRSTRRAVTPTRPEPTPPHAQRAAGRHPSPLRESSRSAVGGAPVSTSRSRDAPCRRSEPRRRTIRRHRVGGPGPLLRRSWVRLSAGLRQGGGFVERHRGGDRQPDQRTHTIRSVRPDAETSWRTARARRASYSTSSRRSTRIGSSRPGTITRHRDPARSALTSKTSGISSALPLLGLIIAPVRASWRWAL